METKDAGATIDVYLLSSCGGGGRTLAAIGSEECAVDP